MNILNQYTKNGIPIYYFILILTYFLLQFSKPANIKTTFWTMAKTTQSKIINQQLTMPKAILETKIQPFNHISFLRGTTSFEKGKFLYIIITHIFY